MLIKVVVFVVCLAVVPIQVDLKQLQQRNADYAEQSLARHNEKRALHGVEPLELDYEMSRAAEEWAYQLYRGNPQSDNPQYGINIYQNTRSDPNYVELGQYAVDQWYDQISKYTFAEPTPSNFEEVGYFTQVIWKNSEKLGVGIVEGDGEIWVVAYYYPPGNYDDEYAENVPPLV